MRTRDARTVAQRVYGHHRGPDGTPLLRHVKRVVRATAPEARPIAWLYEALERGAIAEQELLMLGLTDDQLRALRLVTHPFPWRSDSAYLARVELIARASGPAGRLARMLKIAELEDGRRHPGAQADGWTPPYDRALERLRSAEPGHRVASSARVTSHASKSVFPMRAPSPVVSSPPPSSVP